MNRLLLSLILFFGLSTVNAQINELGVFVGGSNYIGDIGSTAYIKPNEFAYGILYKWNKSPRHSWRVSYVHSDISANDELSENSARIERDYSFVNTVDEISAGLEFNFSEFNLHKPGPQITPYVFSGLNYFIFDGLFFVGGQAKSNSAPHHSFSIPMIVGIKTRLVNNLILGVEVGARYSFADDLDGSNPTNENLQSLKFGNTNTNDWYVFSGVTLTYAFGNKPCYCRN